MINDIIDGIAVKLHEVFGYKVYADHVEQGLEEPCFLITHDNFTRYQGFGGRAKHDHLFDIHFFPSGGSEQIRDVAFKFFEHFDTITLLNGDLIHGWDLRTETVDNVLHCFVKYNELVAVTVIDPDYMESMAVNGKVKK